ncbi:MAG: hypothetical protein ABIR15_06610 [Chitinophagaceae bacterium]
MKAGFYQFMQLVCSGILSLFFSISLNAQPNKMEAAGVYFLKGVMETASAFELKPDSSFEFFFSQGALDRGGKGKWTIKDGKIILNSTDKRPPKDYVLVSSKTVPGNFTVIQMVDKNTMILSYSDVTIKTAGGVLQKSTSSSGEVRFPKKNATEISLLFRLCPDRESVFTVNKDHNYFEFKLEPWIAEVFFQNFILQLSDKTLKGKHPLLEGNEFSYKKEQ